MLDDDDLVMFTHDAAVDPDGAKFHALIEAHVGLERARSFRTLLLQVLVVVSVVGALPLVTSTPAPSWLRALVQTSLLFTLAALGVTVHREHCWRARRAELLETMQPLPRHSH